MKKKLLVLVLSVAMIFALVACGGGQTEGGDVATDEIEELTIKVYNPVAGSVTDGSISLFAERVSELSGGKITCDITPAGTLGAEREATQLLSLGDIDMGVFSIDGLEWLVPEVGMYWLSLPGLMNSFEEVDEWYNNGMFQRHKEVAAEYGIDVIAPGEFGLKVFLGTGDPIVHPEDFAGKIIRIPDVDMNHDYIQALGAMSVSGIDMYTGLQQGTMDAVQNNIPASELFKLDEVIDWMTLTWDMYGTNYWIANGDFTANASDAQREIIYQAAEEAAQYIRDSYRSSTDAWVQKVKDNPDIDVYEIDEEMHQYILDKSYDIWDKYYDKFDKVAMEKIFEDFYPADRERP